jgi:hypothetical protein
LTRLREISFRKGKIHKGTRGDACLVKWDVVCRPKDLGGLGIHNLKCFGRALKQRWLWYQWKVWLSHVMSMRFPYSKPPLQSN